MTELEEEWIEYEASEPMYYAESRSNDAVVVRSGNDPMEAIRKAMEAEKNFYQKQTYDKGGTGQCRRNSKVSLFRRRLYIEEWTSGEKTWTQIKNYHLPEKDKPLSIKNHILKYEQINYTENKKSLNIGDIKNLLQAHPEGFLLYITYKGNSHAVLITRCDDKGNLYGVDPVNVKKNGEGEISLCDTSLFLTDKYGMKATDNEGVIKCLAENVSKKGYTFGLGFATCSTHKDINKYIKECPNATSQDGKHVWEKAGKCKNCPAKFKEYEDSAVPIGQYKFVYDENRHFRQGPYQDSERETKSGPVRKGDVIEVTKAVVNCYGNTWVEAKCGEASGYIFFGDAGTGKSDRFTFVKEAPKPAPSVSLSNGLTYPTSNLTEGSSFSIGGTLKPKNGTISSIRAYFKQASSSEELYKIEPVTVSSSKSDTSFSLKGSKVDKKLMFGKLSPGTYSYFIEVTLDEKVVTTFQSKQFTVVAKSSGSTKSVPKPQISSPKAVAGGQQCTITVADGYKFYYSLNGKTPKDQGQGFSTKTLRLTENTEIRAWITNKSTVDAKRSVQVDASSNPVIRSDYRSNGTLVTISTGNNKDTIYYKTSADYVKYTGAFYVTGNTEVSAYAERSGARRSGTTKNTVEVCKPDAPSISRVSSVNIAAGDPLIVRWGNDSKAASYKVRVMKDGAEWNTYTVQDTYFAVNTEGAANYTVSVCAQNAVGTSEWSNVVTTTANAPVKVRFLDYDGKLIKEETVKYGHSAVKPVTPPRRGYTFAGWIGRYTEVTRDTDVYADYEINTYKVKFYDVDGSYIDEEEIAFDQAIDSARMERRVSVENAGRAFTGWYIYYAKETDSRLDLEHVDSNMNVRAVTTWKKKDLPIQIDSVNAVAVREDNTITRYRVNAAFSSIESQKMTARVLVSLLSESGVSENGDIIYKMINSKTSDITIAAGSNGFQWDGIEIKSNPSVKVDKIAVSVVSIEGTDKTGGLVAETKYYDASQDSSSYWSEWMTAEELIASGHSVNEPGVDSQTQYRERFNTKNTLPAMTSSTPPAGYMLLSDNSYWDANWSAWSDTKYYVSDTRLVDTRPVNVSQGHTEYRYGRWKNSNGDVFFCPNSAVKYKKYSSSGWKKDYSAWSKTKVTGKLVTTEGKGNTCDRSAYGCNRSTQHIGYNNSNGTKDYWSWKYTTGGNTYYWEESKWVDTSYTKTQYSYKDFHPSYIYYKWDDGVWSNWGNVVLVDNNLSDRSHQVETRTVYRVKMDIPTANESEQSSHIKGSMEDSTLSGKNALVLVYKSKNTDPTELQLEYVAPTVLGDNGSYDLNFIPKEQATYDTGDFVVALAIEGSDSYINVDLIEYERLKFHVQYVVDNVLYYEDDVEEGGYSVPPANPEKEGSHFVGWSKNTTNIKGNLTVAALFNPQEYCVAFVDYLNETCELVTAKYREALTVPDSMEIPAHEGYQFNGWGIDDKVVQSNMVVEASWTAGTFEVKFVDQNGEVIDTQKVAYGEAAVRPELSVGEKETFLGWSDDYAWWNVTEDMTIHPIVVKQTVTASPISNLAPISEGPYEALELYSEEGATIYYTLDGSEPDPRNILQESEDEGDDAEGDDKTGDVTVDDNPIPLVLADEDEEPDVEESEDWDEDWDDYWDSEDDNPGVTYVYNAPLELTDTAVIRAMAVKEGCESSSVTEFIHFMSYADETLDDYNDQSMDLLKQNVKVTWDKNVDVSIELKDSESILGFELLLSAEDIKLYPAFDMDEGKLIFQEGSLLENNGECSIALDQDGNTHICWIGTTPIEGSGKLFDMKMTADEDAKSGTYPMYLKYSTLNTFNTDSDEVSLDGKVSMTLNGSTVDVPSDKELIRINLNKAFLPLVKGASEKLEVTYYPENTVEDKSLTWYSDDKRVATVDSNGLVYAVGAGQTTITAKTKGNKIASCIVLVAEDDKSVSNPYFSISDGSFVDKGTELNIWCSPAEGVNIYYTMDGTEPSEESILYNGAIVISKDVTIKAVAVKGEYKSEVKSASYIVREVGVDWGDIEQDDRPASEKDIPNGIWVAGIAQNGYSFTGSSITPEVRVYHNKTRLTIGIDCLISYKNNREAGGAEKGKKAPAIVIKGIGNYSGSVTFPFTITRINMSDTSLVTEQFAANTAYKPVIKTLHDEILKLDKDYEIVSYSTLTGTVLDKQPNEEGTYYVKITGNGSVKGTEIFRFSVSNSVRAIDKAKVKIPNMTYGGAFPQAEVMLEGSVLKENVDYKVYFSGTGAKGTATADIVGLGKYTGVIHKSFKVQPASITSALVEIEAEVAYEKGGAKPKPKVFLDTLLKEGVDYTLSYTGNTKTGSAKIKVKGKGNYKGIAQTTFQIVPKALNNDRMLISVSDAQPGKKPTVTIYDTNGKKLAQKKDYSFEISGQSVKIAGGSNGFYNGTVEVKGYKELDKGNLLSSVKLKRGYTDYYYSGEAIQLDKADVLTKAGFVTFNADDFEIVKYVNNVNSGTATAVIKVTKDGYGGTKLLNFRIQKLEINK